MPGRDDELLSSSKIATFQAESLPKHLQTITFLVMSLFSSTAKGSLSNFIPILYSASVMLFKKAVYNDLSLELNTQFDFHLRTWLVPLSFLNSKASSID